MGGLPRLLHAERTFQAQAEPLLDVKTLAQYTDWMKGIMTVLPDGVMK